MDYFYKNGGKQHGRNKCNNDSRRNAGEPAAKENETKAEKFIRIGEYRMNKAVDAIGRLENLANRSSYEYTQEQVDAMFQALEGRVAEVKARFTPKKAAESKTFSFGTTE